MSKGTLTTLDFVIGVLREHEKELTELSDRLEDVLLSVSNQTLEKGMGDIRSTVNEMEQKINLLGQNIESSSSLNSSIEITLKQLIKQISLQNQSFSILIESLKDYPTRKEINDLNESISSLRSVIQDISDKKV